MELFENGLLDRLSPGKFSSLQAIHRHLFEDIYDFAGQLRTVNLAKGSFRFAPLMYLETALANIDKMPQSTFDEIIEIKHILKNALTDEIDSREIYMKGIDHSYYYEGYNTYRTEDL